MVAEVKISGIGGGFEFYVILDSWASVVLVDIISNFKARSKFTIP